MSAEGKSKGQLTLPINFFRELDRNFHKGGRSFYFFDLDDNLLHLPTTIVIFSKKDGAPKELSTEDFASIKEEFNNSKSPWFAYETRFTNGFNSFMNFRDQPINSRTEEPQLIHDLKRALDNPQLEWKGPSWNFFAYAVENSRPISIITARGHHPNTIKRALNHLVQSRDLLAHPNYLGVYPVSHSTTRVELGDQHETLTVAELKKKAIHQSVKDAFDCYGYNPHHRFGMSDDDEENLRLILEAFRELKKEYPENAFFAFNTHGRKLQKLEVTLDGHVDEETLKAEQGKLFDDEQ